MLNSEIERPAGDETGGVCPGTSVSVIIPTIGRPESLRRLLESLAGQTAIPGEIIVADGSDNDATAELIAEPRWAERGLSIARIEVQPPHAVRQRQAAIGMSRGEYLLMLDDDVELEAECLERMLEVLADDDNVVAVMATFNNSSWPGPTRAWRFYLRHVLRLRDEEWQGRVLGPALRFGFDPLPETVRRMDWLGAGMSLIRRTAYENAGGFSSFFLHRCTTGEDVDLGVKLSRLGSIVFCPTARLAHFHAPSGRVAKGVAVEDDLRNRYLILTETLGESRWAALGKISTYFLVETIAGGRAAVRDREWRQGLDVLRGRLKGLAFAMRKAVATRPRQPLRESAP